MKFRRDYDQEFWEQHAISRPKDPLGLVEDFRELIEAEPPEKEVQEFLEANPWLLSEQFPHCHFILPQFRLTDQYITDFIAPERSSGGTHWVLIEIERPKHKLLTQDGEFTQPVRKAISQVRDWQIWLRENQEQAKKSRQFGGLGLHDMSYFLPGYVIIGRRKNLSPRFNILRDKLLSDSAIQIRTYDGIIEWAETRASFWSQYDNSWKR